MRMDVLPDYHHFLMKGNDLARLYVPAETTDEVKDNIVGYAVIVTADHHLSNFVLYSEDVEAFGAYDDVRFPRYVCIKVLEFLAQHIHLFNEVETK